MATGQQTLYFGCQGPAGVKGMDPYFMLSIFEAQYIRPTGEPAPISWATSRWRNTEYDAVVEQRRAQLEGMRHRSDVGLPQ